ncbi:uncharacterized protein LOC127793589 [Diospyros lotus]|uniref:uncharacterized protein LOC127793589 n=1 Tax=Diospyros lotus TaxID=55363 RepID=UPI0022559077|nr:uncharacterized protein LOC127793589 [Diospyros lotus]
MDSSSLYASPLPWPPSRLIAVAWPRFRRLYAITASPCLTDSRCIDCRRGDSSEAQRRGEAAAMARETCRVGGQWPALQICKKHHLSRSRILKKIALLFLLLSLLALILLPISFAGQQQSNNLAEEDDTTYDDKQEAATTNNRIQERLLRNNAGDYGHYDPAPAFARPRFKLIPN